MRCFFLIVNLRDLSFLALRFYLAVMTCVFEEGSPGGVDLALCVMVALAQLLLDYCLDLILVAESSP